MVERYSIVVHAYVLLFNHYHILLESPEGNVSQAMQWLNTSYSVWFNIKHDRVGALFQYRFKSIPVDNEGSWAFECAMYVHLNPVRIKGLGLGKDERALEKKGMIPKEPEPELLLKRLDALRTHRWSSYPAYAGYVEKPAWLYCDELWRRGCDKKGADSKKEYREWLEDYITQGVEEKVFTRFSKALAIGSTEFVAKLRKTVLKDNVSNSNEREWRRLLPFEDVVKAVESVKGEPWSDFVNRHGDWGRDMALYVGRLRCGLTLKELGDYTGMRSPAVCLGTLRVKRRLEEDKELKKDFNKVLVLLGEKSG
jgi:hypothetical protein